EYHGDALSVEASGVPLAQVLAEIGAQAGFSVLEAGAPSTPVTVSIHRAAVADVLRQLLRGGSHAVLYTASSEAAPGSPSKVARIVLLGRQGQPRVTDQPSHARGKEPPTQQPAPPVATLPALPGSTIEPLAMPAAAPATDSSVPAESTVPEGARVADMLRSLAVPGTQAPQASGDGAAADTTAQPGLDAVLAE